MQAFLDASDLGRSVHKAMFPKVSDYRYKRLLTMAVESHLVEICSDHPGIVQLVSTAEGRAILNAKPKIRQRIFEMILKGIPAAVAFVEFGIRVLDAAV
ncbi:MAG: hypothetical protein IJU16_04935 [Clostridia bacterium]|nr:hypothetical protein [Clostridia bacterium]